MMVYALWAFAVVFQAVALNIHATNGDRLVTQIWKITFAFMSMTSAYFAATAP